MSITIRFGEPLRRSIGKHRLQLDLPDGSSLADVLARLHADYPAFGASFAGDDLGHTLPYQVFCNHRHIVADLWSATLLTDGDMIHIVIPALGGER